MFEKRGQAAIEFLTTYVWAILMILIMIGALSSFGIMNPDFLVPERCNLPPDFACIEYSAQRGTGTDGQFDIILRNNVGMTLEMFNITSFEVNTVDAGLDNCAVVDPPSGDLFTAGMSVHFRCDDLNSGGWNQVGSKQAFELQIGYRGQGRTLNRSLSVSVVTTVQS